MGNYQCAGQYVCPDKGKTWTCTQPSILIKGHAIKSAKAQVWQKPVNPWEPLGFAILLVLAFWINPKDRAF